jgi:hypothetical protein
MQWDQDMPGRPAGESPLRVPARNRCIGHPIRRHVDPTRCYIRVISFASVQRTRIVSFQILIFATCSAFTRSTDRTLSAPRLRWRHIRAYVARQLKH